MKIKKTLNFFTYDFPSKGNDSKFIIDEFNYLSKKFEILNIIPLKKNKEQFFFKNNNVYINYGLNSEIFNFINLPNKIMNIIICNNFWNELSKLKFERNIFKKIKMIIIERYIAECLVNFVKKNKLMHKQSINYSFWSNHTLLGFFLAKKKKLINFCFSRILGSDLKGFMPNDNFVAFKKQKYMSLNHVIILNEEQRKIITSEELIEKNKIHKNYLGIKPQSSMLTKLPKLKKIFFASCGSLIHVKNTLQILKFLKVFAKIANNYELVYYCIGLGKEKDEIIKYASDNFKSNLKFEYVPKVTKLVEFLHKNEINFFLNFSLSEGLSFAVMEALSCNIPIICSNIPGNIEIVNKENGYLIDDHSDDHYVIKSQEIISDIERKKYLSKALNCEKTINEKLSRDINLKEFDKLLNKIII